MRSFSTRSAGLLILVLGVWGGLIPFIGPYFHYTLGPTGHWTWTMGRFWLDVLPGAVAVLGGLILLGRGPHLGGRVGALLALAAGAWFAIGPDVSHFWNAVGAAGAPHGGKARQALELLGYHTALGVIITGLAGFALPGFLRARAAMAAGAAVGAAEGRHRERRVQRRELAAEENAGARTGTGARTGWRGRITGGRENARQDLAAEDPTVVENRERV